MGDSSMQRLPPMPRVVDYAHGPHKSEIGDMLLPAICRFFIGTNSGFATVPGIYGTPNVLTNWVPIALPLWFGQDIMVPKMFWNREAASWVGFREMLTTRLGATQNLVDIPAHIEVRPNEPGEIREAVVEMIRRLDGEHLDTAEDVAIRQRFFRFAERCGSYRGSAPGRDFLRRYGHLLPKEDAAIPSPQNVSTASSATSDTTTPPSTPTSFHDVTENSRAAVPASRRTA
jgi:putative glycosyltransferase (TIGR04372 family)